MLKLLYGRRKAAENWVTFIARILVEELYFDQCELVPTYFFHRTHFVYIELHMDDFHGEGPVESCTGALEELRQLFDPLVYAATLRDNGIHISTSRSVHCIIRCR